MVSLSVELPCMGSPALPVLCPSGALPVAEAGASLPPSPSAVGEAVACSEAALAITAAALVIAVPPSAFHGSLEVSVSSLIANSANQVEGGKARTGVGAGG